MNQNVQKEISGIVNAILDDYKDPRIINQIELFDQPDKAVIEDCISKLLRIVYPGFYQEKTYRFYNMDSRSTVIIEDLIYNLSKQAAVALRQSEECLGLSQEKIDELSMEKVLNFFKCIPKIREFVESDVVAAFDGDPAAFNKNEVILSYPGLMATTIYRLAHEMWLQKIPLIPRMMTEFAHSRTGIDIHPGATIGKYFFMDHGTGIVIGETTEIGEYVKVYQGVTLGALSTRGGQRLKGAKRHPTIEDNVTIYSGASILGGETIIGKGAIIGSNCFITSSIDEEARVTIQNQELSIKKKGQNTTNSICPDIKS